MSVPLFSHQLEIACDDVLSADDIAALGKFTPASVMLSNSKTTDAVVNAIMQFSKLDYLNLGSGPKGGGVPEVTDASLSALAAHKNISHLTFTDVRSITADGLLKLTKLKPLKTLELIRCRQFDAAAIDAFKKARPDVTVTVE